LTDSIDTLQHERFISVIEKSLNAYYEENASSSRQTDSIIKALGYEEHETPTFSDSVYCARLAEMNEMSPFHLDCNEDVLSVIDFFTRKRRGFTSITLGRSKLYFTMFEEKLAEQNMPLELKYLSVIESGLRPQVKSRAGAMGLWQFMYRTGKMYGLNQNSYIDERMDPELATEAACKYLKQLYNMYDDWNMALAAYNAGPGNVNKAIRRSGGKMTYWEIRPFLPRETQGYVPNFIAMSYMMTYHAEHNIRIREPKVYDFHLDTVCLRDGLHMNVIDSLIGWSEEDIIMVNPIYKTTYIPKTNPPQCIKIPHAYLGKWIAMEDSIYALDSLIYEMIVEEEEEEQTTIIHYVRRGQNLGFIAGQYGTTVRNIMEWNNLRSTRLNIGQRLTIYTSNPKPKDRKESAEEKDRPKEEFKTPTKGTLYAIKSGDSLWTISQNYQTSVDELRRLNPGIDSSDLKIGQKIRIK
jgi:membrane-bound lytic murein transglycosylase D